MLKDFRPLNPWGRAMPKPVRPVRDASIFTALFQVHVELRHKPGRCIPVGPKLTQEAAEMFRIAIAAQIAHGKEKRWANPYLVLASTMN